jgi:bidirectional [NiFe] hydrogenase diaphorase subunit
LLVSGRPPAMTRIVPDDRPALGVDPDKLLDRAMARHQNSGDALIEILHTAQQIYGYLAPAVLKKIALTLKLPPSKVLGVATFYHLFRFDPVRAHSAVVCFGTACYVAGATELLSVFREECAADAAWTIGEGRCVGSCGLAPIVICDGEALSRVTPRLLEARLKEMHDSQHPNSDLPG